MNRNEIWDRLNNRILPLVQKPGRYIGGEVNMIRKDPDKVNIRLALAFPDVYEVGMSNLGLRILYGITNNIKDVYAERVYCPWIDLEKYMRKDNIPLFSLETHSPLREFDIIGFTMQYELCYTNILNMLDLANIPKYASERISKEYPFVASGGPLAYVPGPMEPFIDFFVVGDGEEVMVDILDLYRKRKKDLRGGDGTKVKFLREMADNIPGVYVPFLKSGKRIKKRIVKDLDKTYFPAESIVPLIGIVHDRITLEIMRGCPRKCRFCQAGVIYKPLRKRSKENIIKNAVSAVMHTGYEELGLSSLSSTDFGDLNDVVDKLLLQWPGRQVSFSMPSMRVDGFDFILLDKISRQKKTGITLAPEAASNRLLAVIDKGYGEGDVITAAEKAFSLGYRLIKLYFMIGLPGEDYSDLDKMTDVINTLCKKGCLNVSISTMVPKAHTPFQWEAMIDIEEIRKRQDYIKKRVRSARVKLKFHNPCHSILEAVFSRGDQSLSCAVHKAWESGARFDQWEECFNYRIWEEAFRECKVKMEDYFAGRNYDEVFSWDIIDAGVSKGYLIDQSEQARRMLQG